MTRKQLESTGLSARQWVYATLCAMLANELHPESKDGWVFGGIEDEEEQKEIRTEVRKLIVQFRRRATGRR